MGFASFWGSFVPEKAMDQRILDIYTDGSCLSHPRRGGIGIRFVYADPVSGEEIIVDCKTEGHKGSTINQMELEACIVALQDATSRRLMDTSDKVIIHTDSLYVYDNFNRAKFQWPKSQWQRVGGGPVLNADSWKRLLREVKDSGKRVEIAWVKGHAKNQHNKAVDRLAKESARSSLLPPLQYVQARKKKSTEVTRSGSIEMLGQRLSIRIVSAEYLHEQKLNRYRYEVVSKTSRFVNKVDFICSSELLRAGHSYLVRVNHESKNPLICRVYKEIESMKPDVDETSQTTNVEGPDLGQ